MTENERYIIGCFIVLNVIPSYYQLGDLTAYRFFINSGVTESTKSPLVACQSYG